MNIKMSRRKVTHENLDEQNYPEILRRYCQEEDVLIIPDIVVFNRNQFYSSSSRKKSRDFQASENINNNVETPIADEVVVIYETSHDKDYPAAVVCKNLYVEPTFISAFGRSLKLFPTIESLKIERCCISQDLAKILALRLTEDPGKQISDLSLDGNPDISNTLPLFIAFQNGLKSLSVERCGIDDEAVKLLGLSLEYSSLKGSKLQVLNLGLNKIGDYGVSYLARALRINRTLNSLSLLGNQIGDEGITFLAEVLQEFPLTDEEIFYRKRKIFQGILNSQNNFKKKSSVKEIERVISKPGQSGTSWKMRGRSIWLNDRKKNKSTLSKIVFSTKFADKEDVVKFSELKLVMKDFIGYFAQDDTPNNNHPFINEVFISNEKFYCEGCWSLLNLNVAYNYITEKSVEKLIKVLQYQYSKKKFSSAGLSRVILKPGNCIQESSSALRNFRNTLSLKKKETE